MDKVSLPFLGEYEVALQDFFGKIVLAKFSTNTPYQLVRRQYIVEFLTIPVWIYHSGELCDDIFCHFANILPQLLTTPNCFFSELTYFMSNFYT